VTTQRIVEYHIARLQNRDRNVRLESVRELALIKAAEALEALKEVYDNDPDIEVRKAAQEAGREIYFHHQNKEKSPK